MFANSGKVRQSPHRTVDAALYPCFVEVFQLSPAAGTVDDAIENLEPVEWNGVVSRPFTVRIPAPDGIVIRMYVVCAILEHGQPCYLQFACLSKDWDDLFPAVKCAFASARLCPPLLGGRQLSL